MASLDAERSILFSCDPLHQIGADLGDAVDASEQQTHLGTGAILVDNEFHFSWVVRRTVVPADDGIRSRGKLACCDDDAVRVDHTVVEEVVRGVIHTDFDVIAGVQAGQYCLVRGLEFNDVVGKATRQDHVLCCVDGVLAVGAER